MTTVYVVGSESSDLEGWTIAGVFSTREKAEACAAKDHPWWDIQEVELDLDDWAQQWVARQSTFAGQSTWSYLRREPEIQVSSKVFKPNGFQGMGRTKEEAEENMRRAINGMATEEAPEL